MTTQRTLDILFSTVGLIALSPLLLVIAVWVKVHDRGPVFYRARRVGKDGKLFELFKFRTMVQNADRLGAAITSAEDSRITTVGRFLRRYKLDELPQLLNVLLGDMTLVGARPEDPRYVAQYTDDQQKILAFKPGITSPASLHYRNEEKLLAGADWKEQYTKNVLPHKLSLDLSYLRQRTISSDIKIVLKTLRGIVS